MSWLRRMTAPATLEKASMTQVLPSSPPKRWQFDPDAVEWMYKSEVPSQQHPGTIGLSYGTLHSLSRIPVIGAIIQTRVNQVADFARPQPDPYSIGYQIRHRDPKKKLNSRDQSKIREVNEIIERAGGPYWYGGFEGFLRSIVRDSLTYDQANFEVIRERGGKVWGFVPVDPQTIRRAMPKEKDMRQGKLDPRDIAFVQVMNNKIVNKWSKAELGWCIRRPRSWVYCNGYGYPELEELMSTVTNILNAETFNAVNFTNGINSRTILGLKSTMDETMFKSFKREIVAMMTGVQNSKRIPIVQLDPEFKEELAAIPLDRSPREMEFREWLNWLLKVICGGFQMDPAELGFVFGNEGQSSSLQGASVGERIAMSREKGLRPLLRSISHWLNQWVIQPTHEDYMIEFVGFNTETEKDRSDLDTQAIQHWMTIDEIRAQKDLAPLPDDLGKIILSPTFLQAKQSADMMDQEGDEGLMDEDDEDFDFGGEEDDEEEEGAQGEDLGGEEGAENLESEPPDPSMEGEETLALSKNSKQFGQIDAMLSLSDELTSAYGARLDQLMRILKKVRNDS